MENKTGKLYTDDTPRYEHKLKYPSLKNEGRSASDICIQLKTRHFVTCPINDNGFVCVEEECFGCECYDHTNSTDATVHCNGIFGVWHPDRLLQRKDEIIADWIKCVAERVVPHD